MLKTVSMTNLEAVMMKTRTAAELIKKFWDVTPCSLVEVYKRLEERIAPTGRWLGLLFSIKALHRTTRRHIPVMSVTNYKFNRQSGMTPSAWEFGWGPIISITFSKYGRSGGTGVGTEPAADYAFLY
jgi:hypothetical protein